MSLLAEKAFINLRNDFLTEISYRTAFVMMLFSTVFGLFIYYFINKMLGGAAVTYISDYGGDYFAFALIGIAFSKYARVSVNALPEIVGRKQVTGSLEVELAAPTRFSTILILSTLWKYVYTTFQVIVVILFGVFLFGFSPGQIDYIGVMIVIALTVTSLMGFGMISAGITLIIKRGSPIPQFFSMTSDLISGVFIPLTVMPEWMQAVARVFPLTYSLDALRRIILTGDTVMLVWQDIAALIVFTIILLPLGFVILGQSMKKAKRDGSLAEY